MSEMIEVKNIEVHFKGEKILHDLSFSLHSEEMLGIVGPNGAGKSTLLKVILGLIIPQNGTVKIEGQKKSIGYVPQSRTIDEEMPIQTRDFVALGLPHLIRPWLTRKDHDTVKEVMALTNTNHLAKKPIGKLSGGERQRVFLAQALVRKPKVLLLDEPTSNLDPEAQEQVTSLVHQLCQEQGIGILFISHDLALVEKYAHRVLNLTRNGYTIGNVDKILGNFNPKDIDEDLSTRKPALKSEDESQKFIFPHTFKFGG